MYENEEGFVYRMKMEYVGKGAPIDKEKQDDWMITIYKNKMKFVIHIIYVYDVPF